MRARHFTLWKRASIAFMDWWEDLPLYVYCVLVVFVLTCVCLLFERLKYLAVGFLALIGAGLVALTLGG